ncbi:MAG: tetratricopeptide repeat protein [Bryobacteraceae bacterium]
MKTAKRNRANKPELPPPTAGPRLWPYALGLFLSLFVAFQVYAPAVGAPFLFDDRYLPFMTPGVWRMNFTSLLHSVRPFLMLSFWVNYDFSGQNPYSYHVVNVLIHFANAVLIGFIVRKLLTWSNIENRLNTIVSIFAGALFLLHPLQTESVTYVASRSDSFSTLLFNGAFAVFIYRRRAAVSWRISIAVLALFGLAVLTKENTVVLPALLLLTDYFWNPGFSFEAQRVRRAPPSAEETAPRRTPFCASSFNGIRRNWRLYAPIAIGALLGLGFVARVLRAASSAGFGMKDLNWYSYFFTQCRAIWVYLRLFLFPYGQNVDYDFPISHTVLAHGAIAALAGLLALACAAWIYRRRYPIASYGYFAFLTLLAPTSSFVPIHDVLVERRTYVAFLGLLLIAIEFLLRWKIGRTALISTLAAILLFASILTYRRNLVWSNAVSLWTDSASKSPEKSRPRFQLAYAYYQEQRCADAVSQYAKAATLEKPAYDLLVDWALAYNCAGNRPLALDKLRQAAALEPNAQVYSQIGMIYGEQGNQADALEALDKAAKIDPSFLPTYINRGNVYASAQQFDKAAAEYRHVLDLDPSNEPAREGLAMAASHGGH